MGFELIEDSEQNLPVLTAMSEIAGMLLPQIAGRFLESTHRGRGILLGGVAGIPASNVVILKDCALQLFSGMREVKCPAIQWPGVQDLAWLRLGCDTQSQVNPPWSLEDGNRLWKHPDPATLLARYRA